MTRNLLTNHIVHGPAQVTAEQLLGLLQRLPSFHKAFFVLILLG